MDERDPIRSDSIDLTRSDGRRPLASRARTLSSVMVNATTPTIPDVTFTSAQLRARVDADEGACAMACDGSAPDTTTRDAISTDPVVRTRRSTDATPRGRSRR